MNERSEFVLSTHELGRRPGSMRRVERSVTTIETMGSVVIAVTPGTPIALDLRLEAVMEGVLVTGTASTRASGECVRCLRDIEEDVHVDVMELFAYPGSRHHRAPAAEDEEPEPLPEMQGDLIDLEPTLTDAIVLALPFQPLCRPDCGGLCQVCGIRLDDAEEGHAHEVLDPRWAALSALAQDGEEPGVGEPEET